MPTVQKLRSNVAIVLFAILVVLLACLLYLSWAGAVSAALVTAAASLVLAIVTMYHARNAGKNAQHMEKSVEQMRKDRAKPGKILVIGFGIDPQFEALNSDVDEWTFDSDENGHLPRLSGSGHPVSEELIKRDLDDSSYPEFSPDIDCYYSLLHNYKNKWTELHDCLTEDILSAWGDELTALYEDKSEEYRCQVTKDIAFWILRRTKELPSDLEEAEEIYWSASELRDDYADKIDELLWILDELKELNDHIRENLKRVREEFKRSHEITEFEIEAAKEESVITSFSVGRVQYPDKSSEH